MSRVRFAPSPTGSLHVGNALVAAANRRFADERGGELVLRIDDTDPARNLDGGEDEILHDLAWLGIAFDAGPIRQSERHERYREAAARLGERFDGVTLLREDGTATYQLASVVDDVDLGITHVIRGADHRPNEALQRRLHAALGASPPEYLYVGLILRPEGGKLSKRDPLASLADLRDEGIPGEAVRAYLDELGIPRHDVRYDPARIRRLGTNTIAALGDEELAARVGAPVETVPALRGARTLKEAREAADAVLRPLAASVPESAAATLQRLAELRAGTGSRLDKATARELLRELKAVGGDLKSVRLALTGRTSGPELWAVLAALDRDETLQRLAAAESRGRPALR
jgi:glutamyl-tRNA synthetase